MPRFFNGIEDARNYVDSKYAGMTKAEREAEQYKNIEARLLLLTDMLAEQPGDEFELPQPEEPDWDQNGNPG